MTTTRPAPAKTYTIADLQPIIDGKIPVPNLEEFATPEEGLRRLVFGGWLDAGTGRALINGAHPAPQYATSARFYLGREGMGWLSGGGIVIYEHTVFEPAYKVTGRIARFAICKHQFVEGPGANHQRGWHPGACGLCGLDMSIDSGD